MHINDEVGVVPEKETPVKVKNNKRKNALDMVIAFDTTGSMVDYIRAVRNYIRELIPNLFATNPNLRLSIVAFGDYCDMQSKDIFGNAYQSINLTDNREDLIDFVKSAKNTGGGDSDEFYELVLKKIRLESDWREDAKKAILLIADACPHDVGYSYLDRVRYNQIDWRKEAKKLKKLNIKIDTVKVGKVPGARDFYQELSHITNGVHSEFSSANKSNDLIIASTLSRSGDREEFDRNLERYKEMGDMEMVAVYSAYSKEIVK